MRTISHLLLLPFCSSCDVSFFMIVVDQLSFSFPNRTILDRVGFQLRQGAITCLLGSNGSGKTTLFNLITGFLRPDAGSIRKDGVELAGRTPFYVNHRGIARTFQDLRLIGKLSVRENLLLAQPNLQGEKLYRALLPPRFSRNRTADLAKWADTALTDFCLTEIADAPASDISYGQQKLLSLACCVVNGADILLLDEPVAGISFDYRERIAEQLISLTAAGKTILLIEHQLDFLERTGNVFLFLHEGRMDHFNTLNELRDAPLSHDALT